MVISSSPAPPWNIAVRKVASAWAMAWRSMESSPAPPWTLKPIAMALPLMFAIGPANSAANVSFPSPRLARTRIEPRSSRPNRVTTVSSPAEPSIMTDHRPGKSATFEISCESVTSATSFPVPRLIDNDEMPSLPGTTDDLYVTTSSPARVWTYTRAIVPPANVVVVPSAMIVMAAGVAGGTASLIVMVLAEPSPRMWTVWPAWKTVHAGQSRDSRASTARRGARDWAYELR